MHPTIKMRQHLATLVQDFQRHDKQIATVTYPGNRRTATSYGGLATLAGRFSRLLHDRAIPPGERVLLWGTNCAEWVAAFFGCVLRGVIAVPLDAAGSVEFASRVIEDVNPRLIVGDAHLLRLLTDSYSKVAFGDFAASLPAEPLLEAEESLSLETPLQILYTSGTTSQPKGVVHTHGNVLASVSVLEREIQKYRRYERLVHPLRILHTLPLSHVFGQFMGLWVPPLLASPVHYEDKLVPARLIDRIRRERISLAAVVPRVLELLYLDLIAGDSSLEQRLAAARNQPVWRRWWHLRDVHRRFGFKFWAFVSGGAALPEKIETFWNTLGFILIQGYGMTETTALATLNHPFHISRGSIGRPMPGREVRVAEDGEILVRGEILAAGMWRNGRMQPRTEDWLHTGDLGSIDEAGQLHFVGRKSDAIVAASGMNIYPADLEAALEIQPEVRSCVVAGWAGPHGPEPVAVLILQGADAASEPTGSEVMQIVAKANRSLQEFQQIHIGLQWPREDFPRNSMGKLLRREVAEWVRQQLDTNATAQSMQPRSTSHDPIVRILRRVTQTTIAEDEKAARSEVLRIDSLGRMQLAMAIEDEMGVTVSDEALAAARTLHDLRNLVRVVKPSAATQDEQPREASATVAGSGPSRTDIHRNSGTNSSPPSKAPRYVHWPWSAPVQAIRAAFVECLLRPLVALLAHPRVRAQAWKLPARPAIYVANHVTSMDVPLVLYGLPRRIRQRMAVAMSAELLAAWRAGQPAAGVGPGILRKLGRLQAWAVTALFNVFPLPAGRGLRQSFAHAGEALDCGYNVLVFPEGRRTIDGSLQPFQSGISLLAEQSNTAVVPIGLAGLWRAKKRSRWRRPEVLRIAVGEPLRQVPGESHEAFADRLRKSVEHLIN